MMRCPDERAQLLYVEDALDASARRDFEMHLVSCRRCRSAVVTLRDEALLLADVLHGRERASFVAPPEPARASGIAFGVVAAIGATMLVLSVAGFLLDARMPGGLDVLNPLRWTGAYAMLFDLVFLLRDRAPGVLELALSLGVLASVAALLSFLAGFAYRRIYGATATALLLAVWLPAVSADALAVRTGEETRIAASERVAESLVASCDVVEVDGIIDGDLVTTAERVTITGVVNGNVYALARALEITGRVEGSLHGVVGVLRIDGVVEGSVYALSERLALGADGRIGRDLALAGEEGRLGGQVGRDVSFGGRTLELRGVVGRNVNAHRAKRVSLRDGARIGGDVTASLPDASDLERAPGAEVAGEVSVRVHEPLRERYLDAYRRPGFYLLHGLALVAAFLFGLVLHTLAPVLFRGDPRDAGELFRALGTGFVALVATPIAIVLLALTLVALPIAVLALFAFVTLLYAAEIAAGAWLGRKLLPPRDDGVFDFGRALLVGLLVVAVAGHVPFVGPAVSVVALLVGLGLLLQQARHARPRTT